MSNTLRIDDNRQPITGSGSLTPNQYTITITNADTEYSQALPENTKALEFKCRTAVATRFAFETGKVATPTDPYMTLPANATYFKDDLVMSSTTLYVAAASGTLKVEVIAWT